MSTLDAKAIQVLKRRPELGPKLISTLGIDNIQQEIQQDGQDTESFQEYLQKKIQEHAGPAWLAQRSELAALETSAIRLARKV